MQFTALWSLAWIATNFWRRPEDQGFLLTLCLFFLLLCTRFFIHSAFFYPRAPTLSLPALLVLIRVLQPLKPFIIRHVTPDPQGRSNWLLLYPSSVKSLILINEMILWNFHVTRLLGVLNMDAACLIFLFKAENWRARVCSEYEKNFECWDKYSMLLTLFWISITR